MAKRKTGLAGSLFWDIPQDEERKEILEWSEKRKLKLLSNRSFYYRGVLQYTFTLDTLKSFAENFNFMVIVQIAIAVVSVYLSSRFKLSFDVDVNLFVSPIVFPLAFSINADFQRREKVLDDIANFKSAGMSWFFSMRDWRVDANLDKIWLQAVHQKLKSMLFHMREYLITKKISRRKIILRAMYEDLSDANQLIENVRTSKLPLNSPLVARVYLVLMSICLSFERLRVVREYRSPRSIRSFNKVLIFFLPTILSPYFYFVGEKNESDWAPYFISVLVTFFFSALQGVQDKLDDPFDGMSEDDINLSSIDEWTFHSLEVAIHRCFSVDRLTDSEILALADSTEKQTSPVAAPTDYLDGGVRRDWTKSNTRKETVTNEPFQPSLHPYADVLNKIKGNATISRGGIIKKFHETLL